MAGSGAARAHWALASTDAAGTLSANGPDIFHDVRMEHVMSRSALAAVLWLTLASSAFAEPCNPVIDGTYCATNMGPRSGTARSPTRFTPIEPIGDDFLTGGDQPGTLGGFTFRGNGTRCIGLLRRGSCS